MTHRHALLSLAVAASILSLAACKKSPTPTEKPVTAQVQPEGETADQFVARVNDEYRKMYPELSAAQWLSNTYINDDSQLLASKSNERWLSQLNSWIEQAKKFEGQKMSPDSARTIQLLKLSTSLPPPRDPAKLAELTQIATKLEGMYGAGTYCKEEGGEKRCHQIGELEDVLRKSRDYDAQLDAWQGWHTIAVPMRKDALP